MYRNHMFDLGSWGVFSRSGSIRRLRVVLQVGSFPAQALDRTCVSCPSSNPSIGFSAWANPLSNPLRQSTWHSLFSLTSLRGSRVQLGSFTSGL